MCYYELCSDTCKTIIMKIPNTTFIKLCSTCKESKSIEDFYRCNRSNDRHMGECKICNKKRVREYQQNNKSKVLQRIKKWVKNNPQKRKRHTAKYRRLHKQQIKKYDIYWHNTLSGKLSRRTANHKRRTLTKDLTNNIIQMVLNSNNGKCIYCDRKVYYSGDYHHRLYATIDHVIPISCDGTNAVDNLVLSCLECNQKKSNKIL